MEGEPAALPAIRAAAARHGFAMSCDHEVGLLLAELAASKVGGRLLELGTGVGAGTAWLLEGMRPGSSLMTVEIDPTLQAVAESVLGAERTTYVCADGAAWLERYDGPSFDLIFADTWPGKFTGLDRALALVAVDGSYVVDDLCPQPTWPADHARAVGDLVSVLRRHPEFRTVERLDLGSGVLVASRIGST